jgi:hypothetical protein
MSAPAALRQNERVLVVTAAADRPFVAVGDDVAVLLTTGARSQRVAGAAPVAAPARRGPAAQRVVGAAVDRAAEWGDRLAVAGGFQSAQEPDQAGRALRGRCAQRVRILPEMLVQLTRSYR